jgi:hypothetical protein
VARRSAGLGAVARRLLARPKRRHLALADRPVAGLCVADPAALVRAALGTASHSGLALSRHHLAGTGYRRCRRLLRSVGGGGPVRPGNRMLRAGAQLGARRDRAQGGRSAGQAALAGDGPGHRRRDASRRPARSRAADAALACSVHGCLAGRGSRGAAGRAHERLAADPSGRRELCVRRQSARRRSHRPARAAPGKLRRNRRFACQRQPVSPLGTQPRFRRAPRSAERSHVLRRRRGASRDQRSRPDAGDCLALRSLAEREPPAGLVGRSAARGRWSLRAPATATPLAALVESRGIRLGRAGHGALRLRTADTPWGCNQPRIRASVAAR